MTDANLPHSVQRPIASGALSPRVALTAAGVVLPGVYGAVIRPWLQNWGSTEEERRRRYPGDAEGRGG